MLRNESCDLFTLYKGVDVNHNNTLFNINFKSIDTHLILVYAILFAFIYGESVFTKKRAIKYPFSFDFCIKSNLSVTYSNRNLKSYIYNEGSSEKKNLHYF